MPDADLGQVVDAVMGAAYGSAGERCMAVSVVVTVGDDTADRLMALLKPRIEALKVGAYDQSDVEMGPVITPDARERIKGYIDRGVDEGADLVVDGRDISVGGYENGCFVGATVFDKVTPEMKIYTDEIFGPVLSVVRAGSYEEALDLVNKHEYGNGTAIFTRDGDAALGPIPHAAHRAQRPLGLPSGGARTAGGRRTYPRRGRATGPALRRNATRGGASSGAAGSHCSRALADPAPFVLLARSRHRRAGRGRGGSARDPEAI